MNTTSSLRLVAVALVTVSALALSGCGRKAEPVVTRSGATPAPNPLAMPVGPVVSQQAPPTVAKPAAPAPVAAPAASGSAPSSAAGAGATPAPAPASTSTFFLDFLL